MSNLTERPSEEVLIPDRVEIPWRFVPRWIWVSAILFLAFLALGFYSQWIHEVPRRFALLSPLSRGLYGVLVARSLMATFDFLIAGVPTISAVVMLWIAFVSPRWSDRMLWGAAMTFTALVLVANLQYFFHHTIAGEVVRTYPHASAVVGLVAYGSWLLILRESTLSARIRGLLTAACALALLAIVAYPVIDPYTRWVDVVGAGVLAGALFALGLFVADRVGVNMLGSSSHETLYDSGPP